MLEVAFGYPLKAYRQSSEYILKTLLQTCYSHFDDTQENVLHPRPSTMSGFCTLPVNHMFVLSSSFPKDAIAT